MAVVPSHLRNVGIANFDRLGYDVIFGEHVDRQYFHTAGTVDERVRDLLAALADDSVVAIMPVFGGYNSNQLLDYLDYEGARQRMKQFIGFSDNTALLLGLHHAGAARCFHGPSFSVFCDPGLFEYTVNGFVGTLSGGEMTYTSPKVLADDPWWLKPGFGPRETRPCTGWSVYRSGEAVGPIIGGNLETLCALAGTRYFPRFERHILFLEDARGDNPAAFHRGMTQLMQAGVFARIAGLILGVVPHNTPLSRPEHMTAILDDVLRHAPSFPVLFDVNCSHVDPMMTIPLGSFSRLRADVSPSVVVNHQSGNS
jgi:muramoyltetrapeptide carboxypeptidase